MPEGPFDVGRSVMCCPLLAWPFCPCFLNWTSVHPSWPIGRIRVAWTYWDRNFILFPSPSSKSDLSIITVALVDPVSSASLLLRCGNRTVFAGAIVWGPDLGRSVHGGLVLYFRIALIQMFSQGSDEPLVWKFAFAATLFAAAVLLAAHFAV